MEIGGSQIWSEKKISPLPKTEPQFPGHPVCRQVTVLDELRLYAVHFIHVSSEGLIMSN